MAEETRNGKASFPLTINLSTLWPLPTRPTFQGSAIAAESSRVKCRMHNSAKGYWPCFPLFASPDKPLSEQFGAIHK